MLVLKLNEPRVRHIRTTHPLLRKSKLIARGTFGAVYESKNPDRVLKLTVDVAHRDYLADQVVAGPHRPVVHEDYEEVGTTQAGDDLYLFELERLRPLQPRTANVRLARAIIACHERDKRLPVVPLTGHNASDELLDFMLRLNWFIANYGHRPDMHLKNFMERPSDGALVFSDPVFDYPMLRKARQAACHAMYH